MSRIPPYVIQAPFTEAFGGASAVAQEGIYINDTDEATHAMMWLPNRVQYCLSCEIYAVAPNAEADGMALQVQISGGKQIQNYQTVNTGLLANQISETRGYQGNDIIRWVLTPVAVNSLTGDMSACVYVQYDNGSGDHRATAARFRTAGFTYI